MSKMIVFTFDDGEKSAVASWSPEYGWFMAGDAGLLRCITVEEKEHREETPVIVSERVATVPLSAVPALADDDAPSGGCFVCGCPAGTPHPCQDRKSVV